MTTPISRDSFLSTPSARRATLEERKYNLAKQISIHALREEGDPSTVTKVLPSSDFYPRPPRGGRPCAGKHA